MKIISYLILAVSLTLTASMIYYVFSQPRVIHNQSQQLFNVNVDSQTDLPTTNVNLTTTENKNKILSIHQKVNQSNNQFNYSYKITYNGKEKCFIHSNLIDKLTNKNSNLILFAPNSSQEFNSISSQPIQTNVKFTIVTYINNQLINESLELNVLLPKN